MFFKWKKQKNKDKSLKYKSKYVDIDLDSLEDEELEKMYKEMQQAIAIRSAISVCIFIVCGILFLAVIG